MSSRTTSVAAVLSFFIAGAGQAAWSSRIDPEGTRASAIARAQGKTLSLSSAHFLADELTLILHGGPFEGMKNVDEADDSMMMWIEMPDGRTARHPIDGHYYGPEDAFIGRFVVSELVLDQFADGQDMSLTTAKGNTLLTLSMQGTSKARRDFRAACGF